MASQNKNRWPQALVSGKTTQHALVNNEFACGLVTQSPPTLCDPSGSSLPGSPVHGFSRQEYWDGLPGPPPGDFPHPGIKPEFPVSPEMADGFFTIEPPGKPYLTQKKKINKAYKVNTSLFQENKTMPFSYLG